MGHPMRIELTRVGLLIYLANHYTTLGAQPRRFSWRIHPAVNKINKRTSRKHAMSWCKLWPVENKYCANVNHGQWKTSIVWVKRHGHVDCVAVLRLYKVKNFGWSQFPLAVPHPDSSFEWTLSDCCPAPNKHHHQRIKV